MSKSILSGGGTPLVNDIPTITTYSSPYAGRVIKYPSGFMIETIKTGEQVITISTAMGNLYRGAERTIVYPESFIEVYSIDFFGYDYTAGVPQLCVTQLPADASKLKTNQVSIIDVSNVSGSHGKYLWITIFGRWK